MSRRPDDAGVAGRDASGSLAGRLTRLAMLASALALLVAGGALNLATYMMGRQALERQTLEQAQVLAANLSAPAAFGDAQAAGETLHSLDGLRAVGRATLYDSQGRVLAQYRRDGGTPATASMPTAVGQPFGARLVHQDGWLVVSQPVELGGRTLGLTVLEVNTAPLLERSLLFGLITLAVGAVALGMAWLLAVGVRRDVARVEQRLDDLAHRDPVTGLFNRHAAMSHLEALVAHGRIHGGQFSVVSLDLDDFKLINDTLGHAVGDAVLVQVARRLQAGLRPGGRAYRFGGDEFVVICPCPEGFSHPALYGQLARQALAIPPLPESPELQLSGSVGVARFPQDARDVAGLLQASDIAMYMAKQRGKNQLAIFEAAMRERTEQWLQIENDLRGGLRRGELRLHYQPVIDLVSGQVAGAEALLRWEHPQRGWLLPGDFMAVAERSGLIVDIGGWVLEEAARQWVRWRDQGLGTLNLAVNVSPRQLRRGVLAQQFEQAIQRSGADPRHITLELTEHSLVEHIDSHLALLEQLRQRGVSIAIDDFGTGLSSLSYLKRLPVSELKIDRSFVAGMTENGGDATIVGATLAMAKAFGLTVVAEGVETEAQRGELAALGCEFGQGYLFSRPLDAAAFVRLAMQQTSQPGPVAALAV